MWLLTVKYAGTSSFSQDGSQWANKHFVDSSFWEDVKRAGSSRNSKLVVSGNNALCSGRKNLLTCSSVLKAFKKGRTRERVTRHIHVFIASRWQDKQQKLGSIASLWASLRWRKIFASLSFYDRYIMILV